MSGLNERSRRQIALLAGEDLEGEAYDEAVRSVQSCPDCRSHWVRVCGCLSLLDRAGKDAAASSGRSLWPEVQRRLRSVSVARGPEKFNGWVPALSMAAACIALLVAGQMDGVPQDVAEADPGHAVLHAGQMPGFSLKNATSPRQYEPFGPARGFAEEQVFSSDPDGLLLPGPPSRFGGR